MSNQLKNENLFTVDVPLGGFEKHILHCCRASEYGLRNWLKATLSRAGFRFIEDNYKTERVNQDKKYESVHNLVAIRGENPSVCLVSHTDVCREHEGKRSSFSYGSFDADDFAKWMKSDKKYNKEIFKKMKENFFDNNPIKVDPVVKLVNKDGEIRRIIQDRLCKTQVGGDDRLGVAIITWIALNTGYDMGLYFPTDEEIGLKSARACKIDELKDFDLLVQVDRGNHSNELVIKISNEILCSTPTVLRLLDIAYGMGKPRVPVTGMGTDVYALKAEGKCKNAVNMTCGYHESHGSSPNEYIDIIEAEDTLKYVSEIVKDYTINGPPQ